MERVFRREIVRRLFFVFAGVRGNAVQDIPVFCGWRMWPASLLPLRSKFCTCQRHLSTQVSLRPVPVAGLCDPGVTCFPVGMPPGAGGHVYLSWLYPPYGHVCDDRLRFDPLDRSMSFSWVSPELHIDAPPAVPYFCFPVSFSTLLTGKCIRNCLYLN